MDSGRAELGYQLTWLEEPPAANSTLVKECHAHPCLRTLGFSEVGGDCLELHQGAGRDCHKAGRYEEGWCPFALWVRCKRRGLRGHSLAVTPKEATAKEAGPMSSRGLPLCQEACSLEVCGSPGVARRPGGCETAGGGVGFAKVGSGSSPGVQATASCSISFPLASDHTTLRGTTSGRRHPPDDAAGPRPLLNAANPLLSDSPGASFEHLTGLPQSLPEPGPADQFDATLSFREWAAALPRWILKSRSPFAAWLAASFRSPASRWGPAPPSATFPLPLPYMGLFAASGPQLSKVSWRRLRLRRVLRILVLALNFVHEGLRLTPLDLLWRVPNARQRRAYDRLMRHLVACDSRPERFPLPPGRSGPESLARLLVLEHFASCALDGPAGSASHSAPLAALPEAPSKVPFPPRPELQPYRSLDTSRLRLTGRGALDAEPWLQGLLWLPFVEPRCMLHGRSLRGCEVPNFEAESWSENLSLARLWSAQGLLGLVQGEPQQRYRSRVFNAFKDAIRDRQIGDRRLANIGERHMQGPSADLPPGFLLAGLVVPRFRAQVTGYCSDRKDFYHQFRVTEERASTNSLAFGYSAAELGPVRSCPARLSCGNRVPPRAR